MSDTRIHPPSEQRRAEALRSGHVPRTSLVAPAAALLGALLGLWLVCGRVARELSALTRAAFALPAQGEAASLLRGVALSLLPALLVVAVFSWAFVSGALLLTQGPAFGFGARVRHAFAPLKAGRTARLLFVFGLVVCIARILPKLLRTRADSLSAVLFDAGFTFAAWLAACALVDLTFARARHVRSLWLTREEHKREQREAYGSPELHAARKRVVRERSRA